MLLLTTMFVRFQLPSAAAAAEPPEVVDVVRRCACVPVTSHPVRAAVDLDDETVPPPRRRCRQLLQPLTAADGGDPGRGGA